jgi:uncharacterized protein YbcI
MTRTNVSALPKLTRGEAENTLANAITQFEKDHLGRGPVDTRVFIIEDIVLVRLRGVLTPAEIKLAKTSEGHVLIKQVRTQLLESSRPILEGIIQRVTGADIVSLHSDISVKSGERIIVFTLNQNLEERFGWRKGERTRR